MEKFEVLLERAHLNALMKTKLSDRGFITGRLDSGLFVALDVLALPRGNELIRDSDIPEIIRHVLPENRAYVLYINSKENQNGYASDFADSEKEFGKFYAYGTINGEVNFYRVERTPKVCVAFPSVPFRLHV